MLLVNLDKLTVLFQLKNIILKYQNLRVYRNYCSLKGI